MSGTLPSPPSSPPPVTLRESRNLETEPPGGALASVGIWPPGSGWPGFGLPGGRWSWTRKRRGQTPEKDRKDTSVRLTPNQSASSRGQSPGATRAPHSHSHPQGPTHEARPVPASGSRAFSLRPAGRAWWASGAPDPSPQVSRPAIQGAPPTNRSGQFAPEERERGAVRTPLARRACRTPTPAPQPRGSCGQHPALGSSPASLSLPSDTGPPPLGGPCSARRGAERGRQ